MDIFYGVCRKSDYILIRCGHCDFTLDGSFDSVNEEQHAIPSGTIVYADNPMNPNSEYLTHWNGDSWDLVNRV